MTKLCLLLLALGVALAADKYTTKYDNIDLDEILSNERLYKKYFECISGPPTAKCTPDGKLLKETLPDALTSDCSKCSEKQKAGADKVIKYMLEKKPDDYKKVEALFDPDGTYRKKHVL